MLQSADAGPSAHVEKKKDTSAFSSLTLLNSKLGDVAVTIVVAGDDDCCQDSAPAPSAANATEEACLTAPPAQPVLQQILHFQQSHGWGVNLLCLQGRDGPGQGECMKMGVSPSSTSFLLLSPDSTLSSHSFDTLRAHTPGWVNGSSDISSDHAAWIKKQKIFCVATAPLEAKGDRQLLAKGTTACACLDQIKPVTWN